MSHSFCKELSICILHLSVCASLDCLICCVSHCLKAIIQVYLYSASELQVVFLYSANDLKGQIMMNDIFLDHSRLYRVLFVNMKSTIAKKQKCDDYKVLCQPT